ncbi:aminomethyl-transferring glycine dehydrogenase [Synechococcus sp. M16CYN]
MLRVLGYQCMEDFISDVVPKDILDAIPPRDILPTGCGETEALADLGRIAAKNQVQRSLIGLGYHGTAMPALIQRHVFENPAWYTAYTPYQAEIAQGRLEALLNFQTLISELTGLPIANASLLDEATAAAEAMGLSFGVRSRPNAKFFLVDHKVLPQTWAVLQTRAEPLGIELKWTDPEHVTFDANVFGILLQLPGVDGIVWNPTATIEKAHRANALVTVAVDPLAQTLFAPVADFGADIAVGSAQRFGVPMGFGGPHAAFFATREIYKRQIPGRLVGESKDVEGNPALRLALQTREQHIRRDKATSNICTAQVLLAVIASFYAVYHGPDGLHDIARRLVALRLRLENGLQSLNFPLDPGERFDTVTVTTSYAPAVHAAALAAGFNLRVLPNGAPVAQATGFGITLDELSDEKEVNQLLEVIAHVTNKPAPALPTTTPTNTTLQSLPSRTRPWLTQSVFHCYRSETELMRYIQRLVSRDLSLVHGMIPLGSCTMKLNAAAELFPVSWPAFACLHPFAPLDQASGYLQLVDDLERWLAALTGFSAVSLQPNAGSQGEYAGLLVIRAWHRFCGEDRRDICLIPTSAHGTNPASAVMAGLKVVAVACDAEGNIDQENLVALAMKHTDRLAALMVTYPSTHGVFETGIRNICEVIHNHGGQVYLDGANLNAQVGLSRPGAFGADVCHINLHKTFCIPHGGGGPGVGPIGVAAHLAPFLPGHPFQDQVALAIGPVSAAVLGNASILPISWMYLRMMGADALRQASSVALLSANYLACRLDDHFPVLFRGSTGRVAHECILDLRPIKRDAGIDVDDIAKRLMDYGFHAPTVSWPVAGTLMVEPTESESLSELNRFVDALIAIREEIRTIETGEIDALNNPLKQSPHTMTALMVEVWERPYSRQQAAFPLPNQAQNKVWPVVARIDNAFGDRNLVCTCPPVEAIATAV